MIADILSLSNFCQWRQIRIGPPGLHGDLRLTQVEVRGRGLFGAL